MTLCGVKRNQLDLIDNTILFYTTGKRRSGRDRIDEGIRNELKGLEDYYYKLTKKQDIDAFKSLLKTKWDTVYVGLLPL